MTDKDPIFRIVGDDRYEATAAATGPWHGTHCHGGAPAALLASALERLPTTRLMDVARLTIDLMRPVPVQTQLRVQLQEGRQGRTTQVAIAELFAGEILLARASALRVRSKPSRSCPPLRETPDAAEHRPMPGGFSAQFTIVPVSGGFGETGPASVWFRLNAPVLPGIAASPLVRCVAAADFGSGIAHELSFGAWLFPSLDLTISLARPQCGPWTLLQSRWLDHDGGQTSCVSEISDLHGRVATAIQTVLIEPRPHQ